MTSVLHFVPRSAPRVARVALIGNPNTGKTTLFNALCGVQARTANYPGTTTTISNGSCVLPGRSPIELIDLPGLYDIGRDTPEMRVIADVLAHSTARRADVVVVVVDACNLTRNLVLVGQVLAHDRPAVVALNMTDLAQQRGLVIEPEVLSDRLHVPVVPIVARSGQGVDTLRTVVAAMLPRDSGAAPPADLPAIGASLEELTAWAEDVTHSATRQATSDGTRIDQFTDRIDRVVTHPIWGMLAFVTIMGGLLWTLFSLATVPMTLIEVMFGQLGAAIESTLPAGPIRDLLSDGIVGGIAGTIVFLPQICLLFFLISLLEDTGYLARAVFVMDGALSRFGLPGHAFVPLLTSHACALPGILNARLIPNRRDRLATILVAPFMSCSARLPVYVLLTSVLFANNPRAAAMAFVGCYVLGALAGLLSAGLFRRTVLKGRARPMVLELPPYRMPSFATAVLTARQQGVAFLRSVGTVILAICIITWWLSAYPRSEATDARTQRSSSYAGQLGHLIQPVFAPLGFDWQLSVGVVSSFAAREVFVSTMSVLQGGIEDSIVDDGVVSRIGGMVRDDGTVLFTTATASATLVFFVLAMQCLPTLALTRTETGHIKYAALQFGYMSGLAYLAALIAYQGLRAIGVP